MTDRSASFVYVTYIRTTPDKVFDAIITPELARRYWGHENVSEDWKPGSDWQHVRPTETREVDLVGKVLESDPPRRLVLSWVNHSQQDDPEQYSQVAFDIEAMGDLVKLTVSHTDLQPGSNMLTGISKGWPMILCSLKSLLETGQELEL